MARQAKAARHSIKQTAGALKAGAHQWWLMHINHGSGSQVQPSSSHAQWRALQVDTDLNQWRLLQDDRHKGLKPQSRPCWCYPLLMLTHTRHARAHSTKALCSPAPAPATASPAPATASPATCHRLTPQTLLLLPLVAPTAAAPPPPSLLTSASLACQERAASAASATVTGAVLEAGGPALPETEAPVVAQGVMGSDSDRDGWMCSPP